jgi:hypothetical protein
VILSLLAICGLACQSDRASDAARTGSLLAALKPTFVQGVRESERLNDGVIAEAGDYWNTDLTSNFVSSAAFVEYDFGKATRIDAVYLQGDHNDRYVVSLSDDRRSWRTLWTAPSIRQGGVRERFATRLGANGRYLRVGAESGDGSYALTEIAVFSETPAKFPPSFRERTGIRSGDTMRSKILLLGLALCALLFLSYRGAPWWWTTLAVAVPLWPAWDATTVALSSATIESREVSLVRAMVAFVAGMAVIREVFAPRKFPACKVITVSTLGITALLAVAAFFNLGQPQFWDKRADERTFIHPFDMRVYYPVAKYFEELRFDGVYLASVAAYAETEERPIESLHGTQLRDLRTHRMVRAVEVKEQVEAVRKRFSPERWNAFKTDMRYFIDSMGASDYLGSMRDHGGNATPVWIAIAHFIFASTTASDLSLGIGALLDPLLLLIAFASIGFTFGIRTMFVSMVVFGANDFYMFGSNWAGATLRHDWMAYLALGACALRKKLWVVGGVLLALSSLIRAFPATALATLGAAALFWVWDYRREQGRLPRLAEIRELQQPLLRVAAGAIGCVVAMLALTSALFGFDAWTEWMDKVALLSRDPHVNHISLRALIASSDAMQARTLQERMPLFIVTLILYSGAVLLACRGKRFEQTAMLGLVLIPVIFYPANYYIHFIFVLPLIATELRGAERPLDGTDAGIWLSLLAICVAQYYTVLENDLDLHFYNATVLLFAGLTSMLVLIIRRDLRAGVHGTTFMSSELESALAFRPAFAEASSAASTRPKRKKKKVRKSKISEPATIEGEAVPEAKPETAPEAAPEAMQEAAPKSAPTES